MKRSFIRVFLLFFVMAACMAIGCGKSKKLTNVNTTISYGFSESVPVVTYPLHVPLPAAGLPLYFPKYPVNTDYQQHMSDNNTDTGFISSFTLSGMQLQLANAPNFDFLDSVGVYLSADSVKEILIAYKVKIPKGLTQIDLDAVQGLDLRKFFFRDVMSFRIHGNLDSVPVTGASVNLNTTFSLAGKILN